MQDELIVLLQCGSASRGHGDDKAGCLLLQPQAVIPRWIVGDVSCYRLVLASHFKGETQAESFGE